MYCLPLKAILGSLQIETLKLKKASSDSLESLPKDDLFTRVSDWLENEDNEIDNNSYREEYDENQELQSKCEEKKIKRAVPAKHFFHHEEEKILRKRRNLRNAKSSLKYETDV